VRGEGLMRMSAARVSQNQKAAEGRGHFFVFLVGRGIAGKRWGGLLAILRSSAGSNDLRRKRFHKKYCRKFGHLLYSAFTRSNFGNL